MPSHGRAGGHGNKISRAERRRAAGAAAVSQLGPAGGSPTLLVVSNDDVDARLIRPVVEQTGTWAVDRTRALEDAIARVRARPVHAAFVDLVLPDCQGIKTFETLSGAAPRLPIYVLADPASAPLAQQTLALGARGLLLKDQLDRHYLPRILDTVGRAAGFDPA